MEWTTTISPLAVTKWTGAGSSYRQILTSTRPVCVLDKNAAQQLFQDEDPIGKTIEYEGTALVIVGVVEETNRFEPVINSIEDYYMYMSSSNSGKIFLPKAIGHPCSPMTSRKEVAVRCASTGIHEPGGHQRGRLAQHFHHQYHPEIPAEDVLQQARNCKTCPTPPTNSLSGLPVSPCWWAASVS